MGAVNRVWFGVIGAVSTPWRGFGWSAHWAALLPMAAPANWRDVAGHGRAAGGGFWLSENFCSNRIWDFSFLEGSYGPFWRAILAQVDGLDGSFPYYTHTIASTAVSPVSALS
jgi:hypothetical protein